MRTALPDDLSAVIDLVSRLQGDPAHHIAFHGETAAEVAEELAGLGEWAAHAVVAEDQNGRLRAVLSVEVDPEQHRAYLYGPFVDVPANHPAAGQLWQRTADGLLSAALALPAMAGASTVDLFGHRQNRLLADFAVRHDIPVGDATRLFTLEGDSLVEFLRPSSDRVTTLSDAPSVRDQVVRLHDSCFPGAPTSGRQLVAGTAGHTVVVLTGEQGLLGYAGGYLQAEEYYVDVVGVDPSMRGLGIGRLLVRRLVAELAATARRPRVAALIRVGNDASAAMFTRMGFELKLELVSYHGPVSLAASASLPSESS